MLIFLFIVLGLRVIKCKKSVDGSIVGDVLE